jgi:hypothetical protein
MLARLSKRRRVMSDGHRFRHANLRSIMAVNVSVVHDAPRADRQGGEGVSAAFHGQPASLICGGQPQAHARGAA